MENLTKEDVVAALIKFQELDKARKAKIKVRVQRWIENHPEEYLERQKVYCKKKCEVRRAKKLAEKAE